MQLSISKLDGSKAHKKKTEEKHTYDFEVFL